ncbi:hypothetical protein H5410_041076 [Solanum commersonii]|uniref:Uncharacterized protein n=1 Tax=Solanum commersonii TaxID=4109 RepID=A0A9J5XS03_SOLCO|nr:hypothetical protein H5410_041076 [Solanum commersonii]
MLLDEQCALWIEWHNAKHVIPQYTLYLVNARVFLDLTKERLQRMRDDVWESSLTNRFDVVSYNLFVSMASLNSANSFANFDMERIMTLAKYYPDEYGKLKL